MSDSDQDLTCEVWENVMSQFNDNFKSDLLIKCQGKEWEVHRGILGPNSQFFDRACNGNFKEAREGIIDLKEDDPVAVQAMVDFLYTGSYSPAEGQTRFKAGEEVLYLATVGALAEKYAVHCLINYTERQIYKTVSVWGSRIARKAVYRSALRIICKSTIGQSSYLRFQMAGYLVDAHCDLNDENNSLRALVREYPDFAVDLATALMHETRRFRSKKNA